MSGISKGKFNYVYVITSLFVLFVGTVIGFLLRTSLGETACGIEKAIGDKFYQNKLSYTGKVVLYPLSGESAEKISDGEGLLVTSFWSDKLDSNPCGGNGAGELSCFMENKQFNREFSLYAQPIVGGGRYNEEAMIRLILGTTPSTDVAVMPSVSYSVGNFNVIGINDGKVGKLYGFYSSDAKYNYWGYAKVSDEDKSQLDNVLRLINN